MQLFYLFIGIFLCIFGALSLNAYFSSPAYAEGLADPAGEAVEIEVTADETDGDGEAIELLTPVLTARKPRGCSGCCASCANDDAGCEAPKECAGACACKG